MEIFRGKKTIGSLSVALSLALSALAASGTAAAARDATPFFGTFAGPVTATPCGPFTVCLQVSEDGVATHLGRATLAKSVVVHITFLACPGGIGSTYTETATLTAANGDSLELSGSGTACAGGGMVTGDGTLRGHWTLCRSDRQPLGAVRPRPRGGG
jgi:hypothetical protein